MFKNRIVFIKYTETIARLSESWNHTQLKLDLQSTEQEKIVSDHWNEANAYPLQYESDY